MNTIEQIKFPLVIAHRGCSAHFPENTPAAFEAAVNAGARMIEFDVTLTKDRKVIVIHDDTLNRTTGGKGRVADVSLSDLKKLDAGSWFDPRFSNQRLPTLGEVIELVQKRCLVNIEIKSEAFEPDNPDDSIEKQVIKAVHAYGATEQVVISSFEHRFLSRIAGIAPELKRAVLTDYPADAKVVELCRELKAFSWNTDFRCLTAEQAAMMHDCGIRVMAYTVNDPDEMLTLFDMGVDGIFTDDPVRMTDLLRNQEFSNL